MRNYLELNQEDLNLLEMKEAATYCLTNEISESELHF